MAYQNWKILRFTSADIASVEYLIFWGLYKTTLMIVPGVPFFVVRL